MTPWQDDGAFHHIHLSTTFLHAVFICSLQAFFHSWDLNWVSWREKKSSRAWLSQTTRWWMRCDVCKLPLLRHRDGRRVVTELHRVLMCVIQYDLISSLAWQCMDAPLCTSASAWIIQTTWTCYFSGCSVTPLVASVRWNRAHQPLIYLCSSLNTSCVNEEGHFFALDFSLIYFTSVPW